MEKRIVSPENFDLNAFLGGLSHDLANPLNAISMNAELLRLLTEKNQIERVREVVERLVTDCSRCSRFLRELRQFADAVKVRPRETATVQALIDAAEIVARAQVTDKFPEIALSGGEIALSAQRQSMELALAALLRNAAEAGATRVQIGAEQHADGLYVRVADNGSGIADAVAAKLGATLVSNRRAQGNIGLGVLLCSYVARAHGGDLALASEPGNTVATLRLSP